MTNDSRRTEDPSDGSSQLTKSPTLLKRLRHAFGQPAPGGASSTPSPTQGRPSGDSAPGVAETDQRQGTPDREFGAEGSPEPDVLHDAQQAVLCPAPGSDGSRAQPTIRRFTGDKRTERVGPLRFLGDERVQLQEAASEHGYAGESGFAADIVLAFLDGRFTANLRLSEDRRRLHEFRSQVLRNLNRIGNNVNQISRALNSDFTPPDIRGHLAELQRLLHLIAEALREPADPTKDLSA
ncbi:MobC family plasmid mobilization relaxosome protein [Streptomyces solisilvae]|uniref:MobC family plasmid mobilization relaxosome protein n=1 Tax=Streptomyces malaysiensis TaxID=92644 RepID=UPI00369D023B